MTLIKKNFDEYAFVIRNYIPKKVDIKNSNHIINHFDEGVSDTTIEVFTSKRKKPLF